MFCQATVDPWRSTIMTYLPHLIKSQAIGLDLWSLGMIACAIMRSEEERRRVVRLSELLVNQLGSVKRLLFSFSMHAKECFDFF